MLLILDGFDELYLLTEGRLGDFLSNLIDFKGKYNNIDIVVTGRTTAFADLNKLIPLGSHIINLKEFSVYKTEEWLYKWQCYKKISEKNIQDILAYNHSTSSLLSVPLMLYMFCTMLEDEGELINDIFELEKWQFYQKLLDWTCATSKFVKNDDF